MVKNTVVNIEQGESILDKVVLFSSQTKVDCDMLSIEVNILYTEDATHSILNLIIYDFDDKVLKEFEIGLIYRDIVKIGRYISKLISKNIDDENWECITEENIMDTIQSMLVSHEISLRNWMNLQGFEFEDEEDSDE